jgi:hypothetical protein
MLMIMSSLMIILLKVYLMKMDMPLSPPLQTEQQVNIFSFNQLNIQK